MSTRTATLILEDGSAFVGVSFGAQNSVSGEIVFNTGMVGYVESLTDPSYEKQLLVLTFPNVGNYGVPSSETDENGIPKFFESNRIHVGALIVAEYCNEYSHWNAKKSLSDWLIEHNIPAIHGVDTRAITRKIREQGSMLAKIVFSEDIDYEDQNSANLVDCVSIKAPKHYPSTSANAPHIVAVDCGMKNNILRCLLKRGVSVTVVPWDYDFTTMEYDGLFISNGPGDPSNCTSTISHLRKAIQTSSTPIFGICLGNQLLALAAGAKTYKLKYGNRGHNQPCIDRTSANQNCFITSQNHGFAIDESSLPEDWAPLFTNANDLSNEGIYNRSKPFFSVQFHPEACGGPLDTDFLFDKFISKVQEVKTSPNPLSINPISLARANSPSKPVIQVQKVLLLGSGALSIGQAGEFDYSGSQCIKALKEENIRVVLINPNIATIQTSKNMADRVYFLPVTPEFVTQVIEKERPDGILLSFGGQTALNCGVKLFESGVLEKYNVKVLGTPVQTIINTEDRDLFAQKLREINQFVAPSKSANTVEEAVAAGKEIGYPVIIRLAYALGGLGSGFVYSEPEMIEMANKAFASTTQILVEKSLKGWKEVEYEVVRDWSDNCITVCNMENLDPMGVHTGESIVVAPSQTLSNDEYHLLRSAAIAIIRHLGVVGECNVQYALDPFSQQYYVIEVNARLSRSSALASKATGYPLAFVAAKLGLGYQLTQIKNTITRTTSACFEPSLDYCVVKYPLWDLKKFKAVSRKIGSAMKSVGEVMAIGRTFKETIQKAIRMVTQYALDGFEASPIDEPDLNEELKNPTNQRLFAVANAFSAGYSVDQVNKLTNIDKWFLFKLKAIIDLESELNKFTISSLPSHLMRHAKQSGFSDRKIARCVKSTELEVRKWRKAKGIYPFVKQIDTHAAEFPAHTNYLYTTYHASAHDISFVEHGITVLGSGAYRIGSSVEFDWCGVSVMRNLRKQGFKTIMINYNPETVSTDYDECDRLYFEELSMERVLDICEREQSSGVIVSVGGQIPNNLALKLEKNGLKILGTTPASIDTAEDRFKFSRLLDSLHIDQPQWAELQNIQQASEFCLSIGYPVLIRPSYVLSGAAMRIAHTPEELETFLNNAAKVSPEHPVVVSKFFDGCREIEVDAVSRHGDIIVYAISEHLENAGVHSGDATIILPPQNISFNVSVRLRQISEQISKALNITGPFNIQYLILPDQQSIKVIECNLRASRSFPFVSKVLDVDFLDVVVKSIVSDDFKSDVLKNTNKSLLSLNHVAVKSPMFSFTRLGGADPVLGVEMASTGEAAAFGKTLDEALLKSMMTCGLKLPKNGFMFSAVTKSDSVSLANVIRKISRVSQNHSLKKLKIYVDSNVFDALDGSVGDVVQFDLKDGATLNKMLKSRSIDFVVQVPNWQENVQDYFNLRRSTVDFSVTLVTNLEQIDAIARCLVNKVDDELKIVAWDEYLQEERKEGETGGAGVPN